MDFCVLIEIFVKNCYDVKKLFKNKKKRGFATKREALQWERDFINQSSGSLGMSFMDFIELYI